MHEYAALVLRVHDADTLTLSVDLGFWTWIVARSLRLDEIDAPELGSVKTPNLPGHAATDALLAALGRERFESERRSGLFGRFGDYYAVPGAEPRVRLVTRKTQPTDQDKYGRILGVVWLPGASTSLNERAVAEGWARPLAT